MRLRPTFIFITLAAALATAAPAQADDASVFAAYRSHAPEMKQAADAYKKAIKPLEKHHGWRTESEAQAVIDADTLINNVLDAVAAEIKAQQPSTDGGAKAQKLSLREGAVWKKSNVLEQLTFREAILGHVHKSDQLNEKSWQTYRRYRAAEHAARAAWKKLGFKPSKWGIAH